MKTSISTLSTSCDYPDDSRMTNSSWPLRDPAEAMGNNKRHPDVPTEPPDMPEGTRGWGSWERVEMGVSRVLREVKGDLGNDDEEQRPLRSDEPPDEPRGKMWDSPAIQVEPGGKTEAKQSERATLESTDAEIDGRVIGTCWDSQVEVESTQMWHTISKGETVRTTVHIWSTTTDEENGQCNEMNVEDVPGTSQHHPPPLPMLNKSARTENEWNNQLLTKSADVQVETMRGD
jgi:hypothetical protein